MQHNSRKRRCDDRSTDHNDGKKDCRVNSPTRFVASSPSPRLRKKRRRRLLRHTCGASCSQLTFSPFRLLQQRELGGLGRTWTHRSQYATRAAVQRMELDFVFEDGGHEGCVNTVSWTETVRASSFMALPINI